VNGNSWPQPLMGVRHPRLLFLPDAAAHLTHHDESGMDAEAHRQLHSLALLEAAIELAQGLHDPQTGPHGPLRVIFVGQRIPEVDEQGNPRPTLSAIWRRKA